VKSGEMGDSLTLSHNPINTAAVSDGSIRLVFLHARDASRLSQSRDNSFASDLDEREISLFYWAKQALFSPLTNN
jgi:hypothetical protein